MSRVSISIGYSSYEISILRKHVEEYCDRLSRRGVSHFGIGQGLLKGRELGPMNGKFESTVSCTAEEAKVMQARGESRSRRFDRDEALRRRHADVEAPTPYPGWEDTITVGMPRSKKHFTMRLDVFDWLRTQGKGYQTRINAVLRAYMKAQKRDPG